MKYLPALYRHRWFDWDQDLARVRDQIDELFERPDAPARPGAIALQVEEVDDAYAIRALLPGLPASDIDVEGRENGIMITARYPERREETEGLLLDEWPQGVVRRRLSFPRAIDHEHIEARMGDGVLRLHVPKQQKSRTIKINVES